MHFFSRREFVCTTCANVTYGSYIWKFVAGVAVARYHLTKNRLDNLGGKQSKEICCGGVEQDLYSYEIFCGFMIMLHSKFHNFADLVLHLLSRIGKIDLCGFTAQIILRFLAINYKYKVEKN